MYETRYAISQIFGRSDVAALSLSLVGVHIDRCQALYGVDSGTHEVYSPGRAANTSCFYIHNQ